MELNEILKAVSEVTNVSKEEIISKIKTKDIVLARHLYCYISVKKTNKSLKEIGEFINRNHATVIHANNKISYEYEYYPEISYYVKTINSKLSKIIDGK